MTYAASRGCEQRGDDGIQIGLAGRLGRRGVGDLADQAESMVDERAAVDGAVGAGPGPDPEAGEAVDLCLVAVLVDELDPRAQELVAGDEAGGVFVRVGVLGEEGALGSGRSTDVAAPVETGG